MKVIFKKARLLLNDNPFLSLSGNVVASGLWAVSIMICSRILTKESMGVWMFFLSTTSLLEITKYGFINHGLIKFLSETSDQAEKEQLAGSAWTLNLLISILTSIICYGLYYIITPASDNIKAVMLFYPVLSLLQSPFFMTMSYLNGVGRFSAILFIKAVNAILFLVAVIVAVFAELNISGNDLILFLIGGHVFVAVIAMATGWSGVQFITRTSKRKLITLINFGKYCVLTFLGTSVLKSSDLFIIGLTMTDVQVALYAVPLKLIEIIQIIVHSLVDVALPNISRESSSKTRVRKLYSEYTGASLLLLVPLILFMYICAENMVVLFAGSQYIETGVSVNVFRIFLIYCFVMIIDRFSGVTLEAINKPELNSYKVLLMAVINIVGDVIAIKYFVSLEAVAVVTIVNTVIGLVVGMLFLRREINLNVKKIIPQGMVKIKEYYRYICSTN